MKKLYIFVGLSTLVVILLMTTSEKVAATPPTQWIWIDVREYITQETPGFHLCDTRYGEPWNRCVDGHWGAQNEFVITYDHGIGDWIGRTSSTLLVGPIRNVDPYFHEHYRCFSKPSQRCTEPSNTDYPPQGVPGAFYAQIDMDALPLPPVPIKDPTWIPITPAANIDEAIQWNDGWHEFGVNLIDPVTCEQTFVRNVKRRVSYLVLDDVDFGGDLGVQYNVLVIDHEESYPNDPTDNHPEGHIERYYYVKGYGRVAIGVSQDMDGDFVYGEGEAWNTVHHKIMPGDKIWTPNFCTQGGAGWNW